MVWCDRVGDRLEWRWPNGPSERASVAAKVPRQAGSRERASLSEGWQLGGGPAAEGLGAGGPVKMIGIFQALR